MAKASKKAAKKAAKKSPAKKKKTTAKVAAPKKAAAPAAFAFDFTGSTINSNIAVIKKADIEQQKIVHTTALQCVCQIMAHRNTDYATKLLTSLGAHWRTNSLVKWVQEFTPCTYVSKKDKDTGATTRQFKVRAEDDPIWIAMKARYESDPSLFIALPTFWEYDPEKDVFDGFSIPAIIARAIKQSEKANVYPKGHSKEGQPLSEEDEKKVDLRGLATLKTISAQLAAGVAEDATRH